MTMNLYWRPVSDGKSLPDDLEYALRKRWGEGWGERSLYTEDVPYLEGLRDAGLKSAQVLLNALEEHDQVVLYEA